MEIEKLKERELRFRSDSYYVHVRIDKGLYKFTFYDKKKPIASVRKRKMKFNDNEPFILEISSHFASDLKTLSYLPTFFGQIIGHIMTYGLEVPDGFERLKAKVDYIYKWVLRQRRVSEINKLEGVVS